MLTSSRRKLLKSSGIVLAMGLSGCMSGSGIGNDEAVRPIDITDFPPENVEDTANIWYWYPAVAEHIEANLANDFDGLETVNTAGYASPTEPYSQVQSGSHEIDVISMSTDVAAEALRNDDLEPLPADHMPNYEAVSSNAKETAKEWYSDDQGQVYALPHTIGLWPTLGYNSNVLETAPESWEILWDSEYEGQITLQDHAVKTGAIGAKYTGQDWRNPSDFEDIKEALIQQKPLNRTYWQDFEVVERMFINESVALGALTMGRLYTGHFKHGATHVNYSIPKEGALVFHDWLTIPVGAPHPKIATGFLNWIYAFENIKIHLTEMGYKSPVDGLTDYLADNGELSDEENEFLSWSEEETSRLEFHAPLDSDVRERYIEMWDEVKAA